MSASTASTSPSTPPSTPSTPPPAPASLDPEVKVTLPTPSSFSSRRARSNSSDPDASPKDTTKTHGRSVSFSLDHGEEAEQGQKLYRIPQKKSSTQTTPIDNSSRAPVPPPLMLTTTRSALPFLSPFTRAPATAPSSRFTHAAAARGLSIAPALSRGARHSVSGAHGSIWSATGYASSKSGWVSPALNSARSIGTAARHRGLTVAVLKDDKDLIVGDVPLTPALHTGQMSTTNMVSAAKSSEGTLSAEHGEDEKNRGKDKREVIILCRYYHTPGLTCTSRPCRFVHNLDAIKSPKPVREYEMLSPEAKDPTEGMFAQAQLRAKAKILDLDELVTKGAVPGETVVLSSENGHEVTGTVYLMSGGGKGPAGKSRAKFKTVPCKDYAEGFCQYGDYCSFIQFTVHHDRSDHSDEKVPANKELNGEEVIDHAPDNGKEAPKSPEANRRNSTGSVGNKAVLDAWTKALPRAVLEPSTSVTLAAPDMQKKRFSAFAAPYSVTPLHVNPKGELVPQLPPPKMEVDETAETDQPVGATTLFKPKAAAKSSEWTKGPPLSLKKVSIVEPDSAQDNEVTSASHLTVPVSAFSLFGTESDPATPWDPALYRHMEEDESRSEYNGAVVTPPSPFPSPPGEMHHMWSPAYPWGMPMSPLSPLDKDDPLGMIPGGPGVMWTPAGWAVQDAAMKLSLKAAEVKTKHAHSKARAKSYYKTRPCRFFTEGHCPHGDDCSYLHGETAVVKVKDKPIHIRTLPCKFYNSAGGCHNGDDCDFLHQLVVPPSVPLVEKPRPWRTRPCRHWQLGRCKLGDACHFAHVLDPTRKRLIEEQQPCRHWALGRCEKGDLCKFKHAGRVEWEEQPLNEASLARAYEKARREESAREESDEDEDCVEIVTDVSNLSVSSMAQSLRV